MQMVVRLWMSVTLEKGLSIQILIIQLRNALIMDTVSDNKVLDRVTVA